MLVLVAGLVLRSTGSVTIQAVGDVMLGRYVGNRIEREGTPSVFRGVQSLIGKSDLVLGNLECCLTSAPFIKQKRFLLRAEPGSAYALKCFGFTQLSLANNHSGDAGESGVRDTKLALSKADIASLGPSIDPLIVEKNGLKIGMLSFCDLPNIVDRQKQLLVAITELRRKCDVEVVMVHWGVELSKIATSEQRRFAQQMVNSGADLIIGSHPHVLQPVEWLANNAGKKCLVAFSLGNFVFDAPKGDQRISECLSVSAKASGVVGFKTQAVRIVGGFPIMSRPR